MEVSVIQIGNSTGIKFSKTILEKYNIEDKVELILKKRTDHYKTSSQTPKRVEKSI